MDSTLLEGGHPGRLWRRRRGYKRPPPSARHLLPHCRAAHLLLCLLPAPPLLTLFSSSSCPGPQRPLPPSLPPWPAGTSPLPVAAQWGQALRSPGDLGPRELRAWWVRAREPLIPFTSPHPLQKCSSEDSRPQEISPSPCSSHADTEPKGGAGCSGSPRGERRSGSPTAVVPGAPGS